MEAPRCVARSRTGDEIACGGTAATIGTSAPSRPNQQTTFEQAPGRVSRRTASSPSDDDDQEADELETTNCSETMVSSAGEELAQEERLRPRRHLNGPGHSTIERQRLQTGRNRLGTPRHEMARRSNQLEQQRDVAQTADCDRVQSNDFLLISSSNSNNQDDQDEPERQLDNESSELSLASGQNQGPPSYGTATRSCATLDVGQLQQLHARRLQQQAQQSAQWQAHQINQLDNNQQTGPVATGADGGEQAAGAAGRTSGGLNYVSLGNLAAILNQQQQQRRLPQPGGPQSLVPEAAGRPIDDSYGFLRLDKDQRHQQQQWRRPPQVGLDLAAPSATLQRQLELMAMSAAITGNVNGAAIGSGPLVKKRDEGIYATLNVTQANSNHSQQQQHQTQTTTTTTATISGDNGRGCSGPFATAPVQINHVISAHASMQQPDRQQLQHSPGPIWAASGVPKPQVNQLHGGRLFDFQHSLATTMAAATSSTSGHQWPPGEGAFVADLVAAPNGQQAQNQTLASASQQQKWHANDLASAKQTDAGASQSQINAQTNGQKSKRTCPQAANNRQQQFQSLSATKPSARQQRRRRHKSTSGASIFDSGARDKTTQAASEHEFARRDAANSVPGTSKDKATRATISAHCWLIDSNDENDDQEAGQRQRRRVAAARSVSSLGRDRLTARTSHEPLKPLFGGNRTQVGGAKRSASSTVARVGATRRRAVHQSGASQSTTTLNVASFVSGSELDDLEGQENELAQAFGRRRQAPTRRRGPRSCASSSSTAYSNTSAVVRLSAMLSFVSQLASGRTRSTRSVSSKVSSSKPELRSRHAAESNCSSSTSYIQHEHGPKMGPAIPQTSSKNQQQQQHNTGAASSLAYSSSTSAYVTGNSSLHSHDCGSSFVHFIQHASHATGPPSTSQGNHQRPESLVASGATLPSARSCQEFHRLDPTPCDQRAGSTGVSSHHSYEYCADIRSQNRHDEQIELENIQRQGSQSESCSSSRTDEQVAPAADHNVGSNQEDEENSPASTCSPAQLVGLNQTGLVAGSLSDRSRLAQVLMSDNELISSAASNCRNDNGRLRARLPAQPRRRWWWNSFKLWLLRRSACQRTCAKLAAAEGGQDVNWTDEDDDESLTHNRTAGPPNAITSSAGPDSTVLGQAGAWVQHQQPATRYKSLKSSGRRGHRRSGGSDSTSRRTPSTLANVISLAKIDRVFRCRLLASLLVSAVLFALICLLVVIIFRRSSMLSSLYAGALVWRRLGSGSHLSLGPLGGGGGDDFGLDEYDVSWLWSTSLPVNLGTRQRPSALVEGNEEDEVRRRPSTTGFDANLRSLLLAIDRSNRLEQFQSSLTHLSNLQLASDLHIDLVELAAEVLAANGVGEKTRDQWREDNSTRSAGPAQRRDSVNEQQQRQTNGVQLDQSQLDLFALTLLSNLHWPLVKWRHQSQQPALTSSFLSFALPHLVGGAGNGQLPPLTSSSEHGASLQTIRSLLSSLVLVESLNSQVTEQYANLQQIYKLHLNLRLVGYHLATCSQESNDLDLLWEPARDPDDHTGPNGQFRLQRRRFCLLLVRRYRRMMMAIDQLSQQDLAEFHRQRPVELAKSVFSPNSQHQTSGRTIVNFLLDRLAPLDVRTLAEVTLTSGFDAQDLNSLPLLDDLNNELLNEVETGTDFKLEGEATTVTSVAVEMLMTNQGQIELKSGQLVQTIASSQPQANSPPKQDELYELVKTFVGDSPIKRLISNKLDDDKNENMETADTSGGGDSAGPDWQARYLSELTQISRQSSQWFDLLVYDLIAPWPSYKLPTFMRPHGYDLFLHPNLTTRLVLGVNKIEFELERPTSFLILNSAHLNLIDLSLWQRSANIVPAASSKQQNSQQTGPEPPPPPPTADKQIPIRRVLQLEQQEMLYIELESPLEPATSWHPGGGQQVATASGFKSLSHHRVDFGEPPQATLDIELADDQSTRAYVKNQFLLSVSFNKTSFTTGQGAEIIKYADYFSGPGASVGGGQQQSGSEQAASSIQEDEQNSMRALMFSTFNALDTSSRGLNKLPARHSNAHQARQLVPCLDEPHFGARWQLNVVHDSSSQALANTQRRERLPYNSIGSLQMTIFEQTPVPLSPNLLSILVCDQNNIRSLASRVEVPELVEPRSAPSSSAHKRHLQASIWAQFELLNQAELASQLVPQLLTFYQNHLNFVYPLDKLDLVALPNWIGQRWPSSWDETREGLGLLVLSGERRPLADVNLISQDLIERNSLQLAHQLAHQFFGNIVAPQRVSLDLWLFEALAEHLESLALGEVQPNWHLDEQFPVTSLQETLIDEQLNELTATSWNLPSKAVQENQTNGRELDESRQQVWPLAKSSRRGAAIVHMLLQTLLPNAESRARLFRNCLSRFQYSTMSTSQFWRLFAKRLLEESSVLEGEQFPQASQLAAVTNYAADFALELSPLAEVDQAAESHSDPEDSNSTSSERIVFVNRRRQQAAATGGHDDSHRVHAALDGGAKQDYNEATLPRIGSRNGSLRRHQIKKQFQPTRPMRRRLVDRPELLADVWLNRAGFPLVTASCHRDSLHLRQEHFKFDPKWVGDEEEPAVSQAAALATVERRRREAKKPIEGDELAESTWPIPLMFISRLNPKAARFVWFDRREMDISLGQPGDSVAVQSATSSSMGQAAEWSAYNSMPPPAPASGPASAKLPQQYSWFKLNHNASALVRVNYDERNWEALISLLTRAHYSNHLLNPLDRANLLDDALTLMRYSQLSVNLAMNLTLYLELGERDYQPWQTIIRHLDQLQTLLNQNPWWHQYVLKLIQPISIVVGWKDDGPHLMRKLRRELYQLAIQYGDEKILAKARNEFRNWMQRAGQFIVPNLKELVYVAGVRYGDQQEWFHCWHRYQQLVALTGEVNQQHQPVNRFAANQDISHQPAQSHAQLLQAAARSNSMNGGGGVSKRGSAATTGSNPLPAFEGVNLPPELEAANDASLMENEQRQLLTALASTQNTWLLEQFLNYSLDSIKIRPHQLNHVVKTLGKNPVARLYLWRFVRLNWLELIQRFCLPAARYDNEFHANSLDEQRDLNGEFQLNDDSLLGTQKSILETMILESVKHFATRADYDEVSAFFETKRKLHKQQVWWGNAMERTIRASLATIRANIHWRNSIEPKLTRWLAHFNSILRR